MPAYVESNLEICSITEYLPKKNHWFHLDCWILYQELQSSVRWQLHKLVGSKSNTWFSILFMIHHISSSYQGTLEYKVSPRKMLKNHCSWEYTWQSGRLCARSRHCQLLKVAFRPVGMALGVVPCTAALNVKISKTQVLILVDKYNINLIETQFPHLWKGHN